MQTQKEWEDDYYRDPILRAFGNNPENQKIGDIYMKSMFPRFHTMCSQL